MSCDEHVLVIDDDALDARAFNLMGICHDLVHFWGSGPWGLNPLAGLQVVDRSLWGVPPSLEIIEIIRDSQISIQTM